MVCRVANWLKREGLSVYSNLGQEKNQLVIIDGQLHHPDVFSYDGTKIQKVYEIETEATIKEQRAEEQWKFYSFGNARFYLVVPDEYVAAAKEIIDRLRIKVADIFPFSQFYKDS